MLQLLRPFGESVTGKVTIRDSVGASKSYDDFGVRFVDINEALGIGRSPPQQSAVNGEEGDPTPPRRMGGDVAHIEELVDRHLQYSEFNAQGMASDYFNQGEPALQDSGRSPFHTLYLRRLLSGQPMVPHETFAHPVVGVIVTSSRSADPVEQLRELYNRQHQGDLRFPQWVDGLFLRYYVFIHEEETGDIAKSNATFDSMKRHFGLNCHLLRLKGQQCISSDDDAVRLPTCEWMSASEELAEIQKRGIHPLSPRPILNTNNHHRNHRRHNRPRPLHPRIRRHRHQNLRPRARRPIHGPPHGTQHPPMERASPRPSPRPLRPLHVALQALDHLWLLPHELHLCACLLKLKLRPPRVLPPGRPRGAHAPSR